MTWKFIQAYVQQQDIEVVRGADIVLLSVPTIAIESVCKQIDPLLNKKTIVVNASKGFHPETFERMSCVIRKISVKSI